MERSVPISENTGLVGMFVDGKRIGEFHKFPGKFHTNLVNSLPITYVGSKFSGIKVDVLNNYDWLGKVFVIKLAATPVDANLPYVQIDKDSGEVSWKHGPTLAKINLDELDNMEASVTEQ